MFFFCLSVCFLPWRKADIEQGQIFWKDLADKSMEARFGTGKNEVQDII